MFFDVRDGFIGETAEFRSVVRLRIGETEKRELRLDSLFRPYGEVITLLIL